MEYYFEYGFVGARTMVIKLDAAELEEMWADSEEGRAVYEDLTIEFEIDRYLRLRNVLAKLEEEDKHFGRLHMAVQISSDSAMAAGQKIRGGHIEIYYSGISGFDATWWDDYSLDDYGIGLSMPDGFRENPAAWFEAETAKHGFRPSEESGA